MGAGPFGRVERELIGRRVAVGDARRGAHEPPAIVFGGGFLHVGEERRAAACSTRHSSLLPFGQCQYHQQPVALLHGCRHRLLQPCFVFLLHAQLVDDHLDIVVLVAVHLHAARHLLQLAVDADVEIALAAHALEELAIVALAVAHQRGKDVDALAHIVGMDHFEDLLLGVFHHLLARHVAVGRPGTGIEQTEEVVDLGGCPHGGAGILVGGLLLDADDGAQTRYLVDIGALHPAEEVACIG